MLQSLRLTVALWLWKWLMHPEYPAMSIYAPGADDDEDVPIKALIVADSHETIDLILSGETRENGGAQ